ncbi:hypothetical protein KIN20_002257 [Parelaphostrongylus tenuis]|uniref:Uncharacterized protein n=1 Tax=Parelaphostrongylus tenuis TaxID=148309 RepID=A0AAD5LXF6_PARTN|nr:hypothetical protein KIN20_002257 [Parelaphostrongylus tenuis]
METIPSCREIRRFVEEVLLVDRGFSTGETVIKFENDSIGNPTKEHLRIPRHDTSIGQVVNVEVRGDVMVVPWKKMVVKNVPLGKNTELINQDFFTHNYIFYQGWIGNALECVNDVTLLYRGRYRFVVREGGRNGVFLHRRDRSDARKALVPGEHVVISIGEAIGIQIYLRVFCVQISNRVQIGCVVMQVWEQQPPKSITCLRRRRVTEGVRCVIEKVETHSLIVEWIMSPSSTNRPPRIIPKSEVGNVIHFDSSVNSRLTVGDRVKITPDSLSTVITREEFFTDLTNQFKDSFEKLISKEDHPLTHSEVYSQSSQLDVKKSPIAKGAKVACMSDTEKRSEGSNSVSSHSSHDFNHTEPEIKMRRCGGGCETSSESTEENGALANCGRPRVAVVRSLVGQRRRRRCPVSRRRSTPFTPVDTAELAKEI